MQDVSHIGSVQYDTGTVVSRNWERSGTILMCLVNRVGGDELQIKNNADASSNVQKC